MARFHSNFSQGQTDRGYFIGLTILEVTCLSNQEEEDEDRVLPPCSNYLELQGLGCIGASPWVERCSVVIII